MGWTVAIGVDTHKRTHTAVALDRIGVRLGSCEIDATSAGYLQLVRWAHQLGEPAFAVEGAGSYGAGLVRLLSSCALAVFEVERPRRDERRRGKNDLLDAARAAGRLLAGEGLSALRGGAPEREDLRLLLLERRSALRARTATLNQLHAVVLTAPAELRERLDGLTGDKLTERCLRLRPRHDRDQVLVTVLRRLARRAKLLAAELAELEQELERIVSLLAPELLAEVGVGPVCAAQLVVSSGDPQRMKRESSFAALAGTSPVEASKRPQPPPPPEPRRRPPTQLRAARDRAHPHPLPPRNPRLPRPPARPRQNETRSAPLHQTRARPTPLSTAHHHPSPADLTNIEASGGRRRPPSMLVALTRATADSRAA